MYIYLITVAFLYFIRQSHNCCTKNENSLEMELAEPIDKDKLLCRSCKRLLSHSKFSMHTRMKKLTKCQGKNFIPREKNSNFIKILIYFFFYFLALFIFQFFITAFIFILACGWLQQQSVERVNYDPYTYLLNGIRAEEKRQKFYSNLLYVIQESDIYYLVKIIWHGRSIVSEVNDIFRLRLARFYLNHQWSPWNCILLTEEECEVHYYIKNLNNVYSKPLLARIYLLHEVARVHFKYICIIKK